jgi:hypothetical protein
MTIILKPRLCHPLVRSFGDVMHKNRQIEQRINCKQMNVDQLTHCLVAAFVIFY